ncbi:MAG: ribosome maturation factor RimM [Desulfovibrio sp.]|jgi:16S rRNA processing protein RimM
MPGKAGTDRHGLVAVARVAKAHGIRGELCMDIHADSPLLFAPGGTLFLVLPAAQAQSGRAPRDAGKPPRPGQGRPRPYVVTSARDNNGRLILALEGVADRNAAEALRGAEVLISEADLPPPDQGEEYLHKLLGSRVFLADETPVGVFEAILDTPGQLTWVIKNPQGREILFPAVPEFILGLDADAGLIHIDPPPGLLELYLEEPAPAERPERSDKTQRPGKTERGAKPQPRAKRPAKRREG